MDTSIQSAVERIKHQEKENEEKLKEKREFEGAVATLNRDIRDTMAQADMLSRELAEIIPRIDKVRVELDVEIIRNNALVAEISDASRELERLRLESDRGVSNVWEIRNSLCTAVQKSTNEWNIQALLTKPVSNESCIKNIKKKPMDNFNFDDKLKMAKDKLENVINERDRLLREPENGEQFMRLKNALRYSEEMIANLKDRSTQ